MAIAPEVDGASITMFADELTIADFDSGEVVIVNSRGDEE